MNRLDRDHGLDSSRLRQIVIQQAETFYTYLKNDVLSSEVLVKLLDISRGGHIYVFSGIIRDFFLGRKTSIRDLDLVYQIPNFSLYNYRIYLQDSGIQLRLNSFKGLKIKVEGQPTIDCWRLENTWGIKHKNALPTINALLDSAFFNFSAIAFDVKNKKFIFNDQFIEFLRTKELDVVLEDNPNIPLCLYNIFYYSKSLKLKVGKKLRYWIQQNYHDEINFDEVQERHNGEIIYSTDEINEFLTNVITMKFGINWDKYLSDERARKSASPKTGKGIDKRNPFESDFGRVVFSSPIRRMHDKTQVIPLTSGDNIHTRLTHSIEVMNTAKSLAINLCRDQDFIEEYGLVESMELEKKISAILMTAGLVHDIGNPPFGHFGETVIKDFFKKYFENNVFKEDYRADFSEFDGNAQGFRILTHLTYVGDINGLNLTFASLAAYLKYPNKGKINKGYIGTKKHGVYWPERGIFDKVVDGCNLREGEKIKRHPLSFLVEAADSISYLAMDIEDGYNLKWYNRYTLIDYLDKEITHFIKGYEKEMNEQKVSREFLNAKGDKFSFLKIIKKDPSFKGFGDLNDSDWILQFRVALIQYLVELASENFKRYAQAIDSGDYSKELIEDDCNFVTKVLARFTQRFILCQPEIQKVELTGHKVITGLLEILIHYVCHSDKSFRDKVKNVLSKSALRVIVHEEIHEDEGYHFFPIDELYDFDINKLSEYGKLRLVVDFISGMTDKFAVSLYQQLIGIKY